MLADLRFDDTGGVVVARLAGDVDMSNAGDVGAALLGALSNKAHGLVVDLSDVRYFDSAGIHLLYDLRERLRTRGQQLRLVVPPRSPVRDALDLAAVLHTLDAAETLDDALVGLDAGPV